MASCFYYQHTNSVTQDHPFVSEFMKFYTPAASQNEADVLLSCCHTEKGKYSVTITQGPRQHHEFHWIDGNYYELWYGDDTPGMRYRSDGIVLPQSKEFFYSQVENYIQDTPAQCGTVMGSMISIIVDLKNQQLRKG